MSNVTQETWLDPSRHNLTVVVRDDLSLADLAHMVKNGESVVRSPHVGNESLYNCAVAQTGALMVVYERTTPHHDTNYYPGYWIVGATATSLLVKPNDQRLVTHLRTERPVDNIPCGTPLVEAHMHSLSAALPNAQLETMSEYLARHADEVREVVSCLLTHGFDAGWTRRVDEKGTVLSVKGDPAENIQNYGVFRSGEERTETSGLLQPNAYNVLLFAVLESLDHGADTVTHLSGPDMVTYVQDMTYELNAMYQTVAAHTSLGARLPRELRFQIVPTAYARFVSPSDRREGLDTVLGAYQEWKDAVEQRQPGWEDRARLGRVAVEAAVQRYRDPVGTTSRPNYLSQHDVLLAATRIQDGGLYIPDQVWRASFAELKQMLTTLRNLVS